MRLLLACILVTFLSTCLEPPDCLLNATNLVKVKAIKQKKDTLNDFVITSITAVGSSEVPFEGDTLFHKGDTIATFSIPIDPHALQTLFIFRYGTEKDSITVDYTSEFKVVSPDCGGYQYFNDLRVLNSSFESVRVLEPKLLTNVAANLEILF